MLFYYAANFTILLSFKRNRAITTHHNNFLQ